MDVRVGGEVLRLLAGRAALHVESATLLVADAHFGKAMSFRRQGVPVPAGTTASMLQRLSALLAASAARRIVFLGDLLHSRHAKAAAVVAEVQAWRQANAAVELTLVRGNHDDHAGDPPAAWGVQVVDGPLPLAGLQLQHHPEPHASGYVIAGHVHPCVWVGGRGHDRLRLACFHLGDSVAVLPAFGAFTGMHVMPQGPLDRVVVIAGDSLTELPRR